ncbi:hypothetical protein [Pinisolibacter sp.]|uniref:hypothetical protein n=1 Tax=Pinisolibacter sp. TaxID=2172024 RepID=UPI002FDD0604
MDPASFIGPAVVAAVVSGIISMIVAAMNREAMASLQTNKIDAERDLAERRFEFDKKLSERKLRAEEAAADWERRNATYQAIIERLPALTVEKRDPGKTEEILAEMRRLWVIGSPTVVRATSEFLTAMQTSKTPYSSMEEHLGFLIQTLRQDLHGEEAREALSPADFIIRTTL